MRWVALPENLNRFLGNQWRGLSEPEKRKIASDIVALSTLFQDERGLETPWEKFAAAYPFYFFPLNLARAISLIESLKPVMPALEGPLFDFGAGVGNLGLLKGFFPDRIQGAVTSIEKATHQKQFSAGLYQALFQTDPPPVVTGAPSSLPANAVGFFSYSWVEMKTSVELLKKFETLIFMEPSTGHVARKLMELRKPLLAAGFNILAPCTHHQDCPLLIHSQRDWCHDRVHFEKPDWFQDLESHLPMRNDSLTYSYLVVSKKHKLPIQGAARVIGDTLAEKGKTRQAVCFDRERRFLSWLRKEFKNPPRIDHGALVRIEEALEKSGELRVQPLTRIEELWPHHRADIR